MAATTCLEGFEFRVQGSWFRFLGFRLYGLEFRD